MEQPNIAGAPNPPSFVIGQQSERQLEEKARNIINRLAQQAQEQVSLRQHIEYRWLERIRQYYGFYDQTIEADLKEKKQSRAYIKITGAKTRAMKARLFDLVFPTDDRNWAIEPTPVPKLTREMREAQGHAKQAAEKANRAQDLGNMEEVAAAVEYGNDQANLAASASMEMEKFQRSADLMQEEMDDQLVECGYPQQSRLLIADGCKIGTGVLKGPMVMDGGRGRWQQAGDSYALVQSDAPRPKIRRVDPWSFFPDMSARNIDEAEFTYERYLWTKSQLRKMVKTHGFSADAVRRLLTEKTGTLTGTPLGMEYIAHLRSIAKDEGAPIKGRFIGWEYHGPLERDEIIILLEALGMEEERLAFAERDDPLEEIRVVAYFCEDELLKIGPEYPLDSGETLYSVFNVDEAEGSIFGYGVGDMLADTQGAANAAWRMGLDNSAYSVKPQVVLDKDQMQPADRDWNMAPGKIWLRVKGQTAPNGKLPVEFFNVPNNMAEIVQIIKLAMEFADIESGIPMPQQGEQGARTTQTVGGMAILQNSANIIFRAIVKNFDDQIITPTMRRLYDWNMQFNPREDIKGDMQVDARGSSVLLVKEVQAQNLLMVVTQLMANPTFAMMMKPYQAVTKLFQSMMIKPGDVLISEDEFEEAQQQAAEAEQPEDPAVVNAQSRIETAQIQAKSREVENETSLIVEQMRQKTELIKLANAYDLSLEELRTQIGIAQMQEEGKERIIAAEIGTEMEMAEQARARGEDPAGSGGYVSAGGEKKDSGQAG